MMDIIDKPNERIFIIKSEVINSNFTRIEEKINEFIRTDSRDITFDLRHVNRLDSLSLSGFIRIKDRLTQTGRRFSIINPGESVVRIFELAGLESFLLD